MASVDTDDQLPLARSFVTEAIASFWKALKQEERVSWPLHELPETAKLIDLPAPAREFARRIGATAARMDAMCDFANEQEKSAGFIHPVIRSIILHFWLAYDHPFVDGNGRTARTLFYWSMLRHGYWLFEFVSISSIILNAPGKYERAFLYTETDDNDLTYFILYHLKIMDQAIQALHAYVQRKTEEIKDIEKRLKGMSVLNHRQEV